MAQAVLPSPRQRSDWLDRPVAPSWQRITALAVHWELALYATILILGFTLRIWDVGSRAMHHDESLHAYYAWKLFAGQGYSYLPLMHGPLQFEVVPLFYLLFGVSEFSARLLPVLLGTALIPLPYLLRHHLSKPGALLASAMLAISPSLLYYSRFIRDDIYLAFFSLLLFAALVLYLETHRAKYLYIAAAAMALAMASMEAAYLTFLIFGTFLIFETVREFLQSRDGPVLAAIKATSLDTWLTAISIFVVITVVTYSTFFTNPYGIWDPRYSLTSPNRQDILGGITYWQVQHGVARGGQPWFYYLLVLPLYEQLAVVFGIAGAIYCMVRRSLVRTFLVWWAAGSILLYSWAGEKMPWLSIHILLPFIILAGLFLGAVFACRRRWIIIGTAVVFSTLLTLEIHSAFALSFQDGTNPTEMLIYVQTSQDVPNVVHEIAALSQRTTGGKTLQIGLDNTDVGGWPFIWYLRDYPNVTETSSFSGPQCGGKYCAALLMLQPAFDTYSSSLLKHYVVQRYRWNWWFPEDYKVWFPHHVGSIALAASGRGALSDTPVGSPTDWSHLWNWLVYRRPFGERGARWLYFLVRRDLVPNAKNFSTKPSTAVAGAAPIAASKAPDLPTRLGFAAGSASSLAGPRGLAAAPNGDLYTADPAKHQVVQFSSSGALLRAWGSVGTGPGQFNTLTSPEGLAVAANGSIYVADTWNERIEVFSSSGRFLRMWGGGAIGSRPGQFYGPRSIAIGSRGRVYVADTGNERIQVFNGSGRYLFRWGTSGTDPGQFMEPSSVAIGPSGDIYVSDFWNQRIQEFTATGGFIRSWSVVDWAPHSYDEPYLAVSPRTGDVFASEPQQRRLLAWTSTGHLLGAVNLTNLSLPDGVAVLPPGKIAVSDVTGTRIQTLTLKARATAKGQH